MNDINLQHQIGDVVSFNGVALLYQTKNCTGDLKENNLGIIVKRILFALKHHDENDCQEINDGSVIQEPEFVYTVLSNGLLIEVLDIDVNNSIARDVV